MHNTPDDTVIARNGLRVPPRGGSRLSDITESQQSSGDIKTKTAVVAVLGPPTKKAVVAGLGPPTKMQQRSMFSPKHADHVDGDSSDELPLEDNSSEDEGKAAVVPLSSMVVGCACCVHCFQIVFL